jgi:GNAT superfamily N-acetyltransferase
VELPDLPRWVEAHGIAADPASWRAPLGDGFAVGSARAKLVVASPDAALAPLAALAAAHADHAVIFARERDDLRAAFSATTTIVLHTLPDPAALPDPAGATTILEHGSLAHAPGALAAELAAARTPIHAAYVDDAPVAFAYAPWRSAAWFDVSVDVLPAARQLGLGALVAAACIRAELALGRAPVWGAAHDNTASLRLAARLGFETTDALYLAAPRC